MEMARTSHDLQRDFEFKKEKQYSDSIFEIENMKKNLASQILTLEDQNRKLEALNSLKNAEFETQLNENRNLKVRFEE